MTKSLPDINHLVVAYLDGWKFHSDVQWMRAGWAFHVRRDEATEETVADGWSTTWHDSALEKIDADAATVTRWLYVRDLMRLSNPVDGAARDERTER